MSLVVHNDGFGASGVEAELVEKMVRVLQGMKGERRDIQLGILYDTWHDELGEEVPDCLKKFIEMAKKANP